MWTAKKSADREDRRRLEEIERQTADERIKKLYDPLLAIITPGPPYDEFYIDHQTQAMIINKIEENERLASPDLLNVYWQFCRAHYDQSGSIDRELEWKIYELVLSEHSRLKKTLGYGRILKKKSIIKLKYEKIQSHVEKKISEFRRKRHVSKVRKRRK